VTSGGVSENHCTPILFGQLPSIHISSSLIIYLYYTTGGIKCQGFIIALIRRSGKESNPTQLMNSIQNSFLTTLRLMERPLSLTQPCRRELSRFAIPFSFSTYIISNLAANVKSLLIIIVILLPCACYLLTEVFNPRPSGFFTLESLLEGGLSVEASPLKLLKQSFLYQLILQFLHRPCGVLIVSYLNCNHIVLLCVFAFPATPYYTTLFLFVKRV